MRPMMTAEQRRALTLLASDQRGSTEALMLAHGFHGDGMSATDDPPVEIPTRHPLDISIREKMELSAYRVHIDQWDKANDRLLADPQRAITSAPSLFATTSTPVLTH